ncbi:MAG: tetratricopeptide repeat protein [Phycisphaerales bacterium]
MADKPTSPSAVVEPSIKPAGKPVLPKQASGVPGKIGAPEPRRALWHVPVLIGSLALLAGGVLVAIRTAPKPDYEVLIAAGEKYVEDEKYDEALEHLNKKVKPYYDRNMLTPPQGARFHLARARSVYLGQRHAGIDLEVNARTVVDEYGDAMADHTALEPRDKSYLADAHVTLGHLDRALELATALPDTAKDQRAQVLKRIVVKQIATPKIDPAKLLQSLSDFVQNPSIGADDRAWALARQTDLLRRQGQTQTAVARLLQAMPSLVEEANPELLGDLYLSLGRAYVEMDALSDAAKQFDRAAMLLVPTDERQAAIQVLLARIDEANGITAEARQRYAETVEKFSTSPTRLLAMHGLGEAEAALGDHAASLKAYDELVAAMTDGLTHPELTTEAVAGSLLGRSRARFDAGVTGEALRYAELSERLFPGDKAPPDLVLALAEAHRRSADELLSGAEHEPTRVGGLALIDPAAREEARTHLVAAGGYFKRHADLVGIADNDAYGRSLWLAADCLDRAGDPDQAIPLLTDFAKYFPGDPLQPEARFRTAQAHQTRGDYAVAAATYQQLLDDAGSVPPGGGSSSGPFADASVVPLAQCLLLDADPTNDAQAEELIEAVVQGRYGGADSPNYRDALVERAMLRSRKGEHAAAIQSLEEAIERFPDDPQIDTLRYRLGDAYRRDAEAITATLATALPDAQRQLLTRTRAERLTRGMGIYAAAERSLSAKDPARLTRLELVQLRNSSFYVADCAFDLRDFDGAIRLYDAARERYPDDPASLVAMVQIVNAYVEQGDMERARTANERATNFYRSLPASAWSDPDLPMGREEWGRWLESLNALKPLGATPTAEPTPVAQPDPKEHP